MKHPRENCESSQRTSTQSTTHIRTHRERRVCKLQMSKIHPVGPDCGEEERISVLRVVVELNTKYWLPVVLLHKANETHSDRKVNKTKGTHEQGKASLCPARITNQNKNLLAMCGGIILCCSVVGEDDTIFREKNTKTTTCAFDSAHLGWCIWPLWFRQHQKPQWISAPAQKNSAKNLPLGNWYICTGVYTS